MASRLVFGAGVVLGLATIAPADSLLGSSGDGWSAAGWVQRDPSTFPAPVRNSPGLFLSTGQGPTYPPTEPFAELKRAAEVEAIIGANPYVEGRVFDAGGPFEGSVAWTSFDGYRDDVLSVDWDFITGEGSSYQASAVPRPTGPTFVNDFAFLAIRHAGVTTVERLADDFTPGMNDIAEVSGWRFLFHTGPQTYRYALPADGRYTLYLGVLDGRYFDEDDVSEMGESALLVKSVELTPAGASPVPTPVAAAGGFALLCGLAAARRRRD